MIRIALCAMLLIGTGCTTTVYKTEPITAQEQREIKDKERQDGYIWQLMTAIPLFIIAL